MEPGSSSRVASIIGTKIGKSNRRVLETSLKATHLLVAQLHAVSECPVNSINAYSSFFLPIASWAARSR
jgi:hypothetical protein